MRRTLEISRSAGVRVLLVHALDAEATNFYRRLGFEDATSEERTLYLPIETIAVTL